MSFFENLFKRTPEVVSDPAKVPDVFKQLSPLFDEIGGETVRCIPENWTNAVLTITCDGRRIDYSLKNNRNESGQASISQCLAKLTEQLYSFMASSGNRWTQAVLTYDNDGNAWHFKSSFTYDR